MQEFAGGMKFAFGVEDGAESARFAGDPEKKKQADKKHEGRADAFEEFDGFDAAPDDEHVDGPEKEKAQPIAAGNCCGPGPDDAQHGIDGGAADPGLNAEPAAGDQSAEYCGNVCAAHAERSANKNGERNAVFCAGVGVEEHGHEHDEVAEQDGDDGLPPVHAAGDQAGGQHVGGNADAHGHPERGVIVSAPGALLEGDGREVVIVERGVGVGEIHAHPERWRRFRRKSIGKWERGQALKCRLDQMWS